MLLHPNWVDLTPMEIAEHLCRISSMVLVSGEKRQRLPKIVVDGVEDYGTASSRDTGRLLRCWDDGRRSMFNLSKAEGALDNVEETFQDAEEIEGMEVVQLIRDLNGRKIFRQDIKINKYTTKAVQLSVLATRITRIVVRVGTIDIDVQGHHTKMPEVVCDSIESRKRKAADSIVRDDVNLAESLVTIQASETSPVIEVSRKRSWVVPSVHVFDD